MVRLVWWDRRAGAMRPDSWNGFMRESASSGEREDVVWMNGYLRLGLELCLLGLVNFTIRHSYQLHQLTTAT